MKKMKGRFLIISLLCLCFYACGNDDEFGVYQLGFPNKEVENGYYRYLLPKVLESKNGK